LQPGTKLKIANTPETEYLLQPEISAIYKGLQYKEDVKGISPGGDAYTYRGYVTADGLAHVVGIITYENCI